MWVWKNEIDRHEEISRLPAKSLAWYIYSCPSLSPLQFTKIFDLTKNRANVWTSRHMAVVVNETMMMAVKAWDSVYVTSLFRMVLLPFIKAAYTPILHVRILWFRNLMCDLIRTVYDSNSNKSKCYTWRNFCGICFWDFISLWNWHSNLTFRGTYIAIYSYNESQRDALFLTFICQITLHVSERSAVHHQEYLKTVYT